MSKTKTSKKLYEKSTQKIIKKKIGDKISDKIITGKIRDKINQKVIISKKYKCCTPKCPGFIYKPTEKRHPCRSEGARNIEKCTNDPNFDFLTIGQVVLLRESMYDNGTDLYATDDIKLYY